MSNQGEKLSIDVIGCGDFGAEMSELISSFPQYEIHSVCDVSEDRAQAMGKKFGVPAFTSYEECLAQSHARAVALFTPNNLHCPMALMAARAGKHIFCEKPMAITVEECHDMMEAADAANVKLMVGHKRRLRPPYAKMAQIVKSQRYGRLLSVNINGFYGRRGHGWWMRRKTGGGLLYLSGVHDIDFLRCLCGDAGSVCARTPIKTDHLSDYEDAISILIQFESGVVATLEVCPLFSLRTFRRSFAVELVCECGAITYDPFNEPKMIVRAQGADSPIETFEFENEAGFVDAYTQEFTSFAEWVLKGTAPVLNAWDGLRCVEIMEAASLSAYSGKDVQPPLPRRGARRAVFGAVSQQTEMDEPEVYARGLSMPEGPAFDKDGNLFVANCRSNYVSKILPTGEVEPFVTTGGKTQGVAIHPDGSLYITDITRRAIFKSSPAGELSTFCDSYQDGQPLRGPNEIAFGPNGQIYFTDPGDTWRGDRTGALSRVNEHGKAEFLADGLEFTNGLDFSPDGNTLYVVESTTGKILRARLRTDGNLDEPLHEFMRFGGRVGPDGIRFAANGDLYVTLFGHGEIAVVSPAGEVRDRLRLPGLFPTNCIFRGTDLLVCEGQTGSIWKIAVAIAGLPSYAERIWHKDFQ